MIDRVLTKIFGTQHERDIKKLAPRVEAINALEPSIKALSDEELRAKTDSFRARIAAALEGVAPEEQKAVRDRVLDEILNEAFAVAREASVRTLGMRPFDVQLIGGMVLHQGKIAAMKTGEGKTLVATMPVYLNALTGRGVHVVTVNDYLARRDAEWMGRIYKFLGLTVGCIQNNLLDEERQKAYGSDVTYGTNNEFGFDYLRDNMKFELENMVQRGHVFAIVDEVDSILIDEARTPLIISGPSEENTEIYYRCNRVIPHLTKGTEEKDKYGNKITTGDYLVDEKSRTAVLTEEGVLKAEKNLRVDNLYDLKNIDLLHGVEQALRAHTLYKRDVDYMIKDGQVLIVDEFTGRVLPGRRWSDGLHQAVEAKEGVRIERENQTLATITLQNYFRMYEKLAGMTGTADTEAAEFHQIYKLDVVVIPTNMPMIRKDHQDVVYASEREKYEAVAEEIAALREKGQPVLVGTVSIEKSEHLSSMLKARKIPHVVLNAKFHEKEAEIVAQAGKSGSVTIATNMAGRGTDIVLGGNPDAFAEQRRKETESEAQFQKLHAELKAASVKDRETVLASGGLMILGTERHESRRVDNQLRGRSGRQGDPGESRFYLSLEDDLMRMFNSDKVAHFMEWLKTPPEVPIESKAVSRSIRSAQTQVEQQNFEIRKDVLKYDDVLNRQRKVVYAERREVLEGADLHEQVRQMIDEVVTAYVSGATEDGFPEEWDLDRLWTAFRELYHPSLTIGDVEEEAGGDRAGLSREFLVDIIEEDAQKAYDRREEDLTPEVMRELERRVVLSVLDRKWREHLYEMDYLREGIGLRAMAQRDPLIEYQREGYDLFNNMMEGIKEESVGNLFNLQVEVQQNPIVEEAEGADAAAPLGLQVAPPGQQIAPAGAGGPGAGNAPGNGAPRGRHAAGGRGAQAGRGRGAQSDAQPGDA